MTWFLLKFLIRILVFGTAIAFATKRVKDVKVEPPAALPLVAFLFALLNALLYHALSFALNLATLFVLWFAVPFLANAAVLYVTDRLAKPLKIESFTALLYTSGIVTVAHVAMRLVGLR